MRVYLNRKNIKICILIAFLVAILTVLMFLPFIQSKVTDDLDTDAGFYVDFGDLISEYDDNDTDDYIDGFENLLIRKKIKINIVNGKRCKERRNFVFIKTMKCATQTVVAILRRFGYLRHLNFVLPRRENIYLGWPYTMEKIDYRPSTKTFNALVEHSVYNKTVMSAIMPEDTAYVTIIREPFSHFKSAFNYFNVANISKVPVGDQISEYLHNLDKYETFYKSHEGSTIRYCIPDGYSVTKNLLSNCLGMPLGFPPGRENITDNLTAIQKYIADLDNEFTLVMIMEYFHESLVLLKRIMCWSTQDILYRASNVGNYVYKHTKPREDDLNIYKQWSHVDYLLYDHFNQTFWKKVAEQSDDFRSEVLLYNEIQEQVSEFCSNIKGDSLEIPPSEFNDAFVVSPDFCIVMGADLLTFLRKRFDREENWVEPEVDKKLPRRGC